MPYRKENRKEHLEENKLSSIREVISIIPKSCYDNPTWKGLTYFLINMSLYCVLLFCLTKANELFLIVPLWILTGIAITGLFIIAHDAAHNTLMRNKALGKFIGRVSMLPSFHNYTSWVIIHNKTHHIYTVEQNHDPSWHSTSFKEYNELSLKNKLIHRIEWSVIGAGIYFINKIWWNGAIYYSLSKKNKKKTYSLNYDRLLGICFFLLTITITASLASPNGNFSVTSFILIWAKVFLIPWIVFSYIAGAIIYLHHIQPNLAWHTHEGWDGIKGQIEGTTNFLYPRILNILLHNIFIHIPHHVDPRIPFYNLPEATEAIDKYFPSLKENTTLSLRKYLETIKKCKLYDFEQKHWTNYKGEMAI